MGDAPVVMVPAVVEEESWKKKSLDGIEMEIPERQQQNKYIYFIIGSTREHLVNLLLEVLNVKNTVKLFLDCRKESSYNFYMETHSPQRNVVLIELLYLRKREANMSKTHL